MDSNNKTERLGIKDLSHTNMADRLETANIHSNRATEIIHLQRCIHRYWHKQSEHETPPPHAASEGWDECSVRLLSHSRHSHQRKNTAGGTTLRGSSF